MRAARVSASATGSVGSGSVGVMAPEVRADARRTLRGAAERWGQTTAYVASKGWTVTYADLDRLADEVAVGLAERGLGEGDVLALVLPPTPEYLIAYLAAARLGATTAGVNARLTREERAAVLAKAGPALVLATAELAPGATM